MPMQAHALKWRPDTMALVGLGVVGRGWLRFIWKRASNE